jgi:Bifunctional DNA primase/polymerase, N-terminal/Family of unknown function (DUF5906)
MNIRRTWKKGLSQENLERAHLRAMSCGRSDAALGYVEKLRWPVIPVDTRPNEDSRKEKKAIGEWKLYQTEHPTSEHIKKCWKQNPYAGIGIVTGRLSGLVVLDFDDKESHEWFEREVCQLPETLKQTSGRGVHYFFRYPDNEEIRNKQGVEGQRIDVRGEGGYIIAAPSIHPIGRQYTWDGIDPLYDGIDALADLPDEILQFLKTSRGYGKDYKSIKELNALNQKYAAVLSGSTFAVLKEGIDQVTGHPDIKLFGKTDIINWFENKTILVPDPNKPGKFVRVNKIIAWIKYPKRRSYEDLIFEPGKDIPNCYNLWRGFAVHPEQGDWSLFHGHILDNIAGGEEEYYRWILAWMSRLVQDPGGPKPGTAIAIRGKQGTGKGIFANYFGKLFGNHYLPISQPKQLVGRFNSHYKACLLAFVDEAFWAGDKEAKGVLKSLITESTIIIEPKFKDAFAVTNYTHFIFASNEEWVVPTEWDDRRFMVLDISDHYKEDHAYFGAICRQMDEQNGIEAMMYDLMDMDISDINLRTPPKTKALFEQKLQSASPLEFFWYSRLKEGTLLKAGRPVKNYQFVFDHISEWHINRYQTKWDDRIPTQVLYAEYKMFVKEMGRRDYVTDVHFVRGFKKICPGIESKRLRIVIDGVGKEAGHLMIPPLGKCRNDFEENWNAAIDW